MDALTLSLVLTIVLAPAAVSAAHGGTATGFAKPNRQITQTSTSARGTIDVQSIARGLRDSDSEVRFLAIAELSRLVMETSDGRPSNIDLRSSPSLRAALIGLLDDADFRIRGGVVKVLAFVVDWPDEHVASLFIARYSQESDPGVRSVIVHELSQRALDSPGVRRLMSDALSDEATSVRRNAAKAIARFHPRSALPRIVDELRSGNEATRSEFVYALESYGALAKPHVRVLEALLPNEVNPERSEQIRRAIRAVHDARQ